MKTKDGAAAELREFRKRAKGDLAADVLPSAPRTAPRVLPVVVEFDLGGVTNVLRAGKVIASVDHALIERESPELHRLIRLLLEQLSEQACVAVAAVSVANLRLGMHDGTAMVKTKRAKSLPEDTLLRRRSRELLAINPRLSNSALARQIINKHPDERRGPDWLRQRIAKLRGG